jgi:hypothetical protein
MQQTLEPDESLATALPANGAVVLRSFGKTYGLAGLRLGFALASPDIVAPLRAGLGALAGRRPGDCDRDPRARRFGLARSDARAPRQGGGAARRPPA